MLKWLCGRERGFLRSHSAMQRNQTVFLSQENHNLHPDQLWHFLSHSMRIGNPKYCSLSMHQASSPSHWRESGITPDQLEHFFPPVTFASEHKKYCSICLKIIPSLIFKVPSYPPRVTQLPRSTIRGRNIPPLHPEPPKSPWYRIPTGNIQRSLAASREGMAEFCSGERVQYEGAAGKLKQALC